MSPFLPAVFIILVLSLLIGLDNMRLRKRLHSLGVDPEAEPKPVAPDRWTDEQMVEFVNEGVAAIFNRIPPARGGWVEKPLDPSYNPGPNPIFEQKPCDPRTDPARSTSIEDAIATAGLSRAMTTQAPSPVLTNLAAAFAAKVEPTERLVLLALVAGADDNGISRQVTRFLASLTGLHTSTVAAAFRSLSKAGLIADTGERHGSRNQHRIWQVFPSQEQTSD